MILDFELHVDSDVILDNDIELSKYNIVDYGECEWDKLGLKDLHITINYIKKL